MEEPAGMTTRRTNMSARLAAAEAELANLRAREQPAIRGPNDVAGLIREACHPEQETFVVVLLNARQKPLATIVVGLGSIAHVDVYPREVFRDAVRMNAHSIVIGHNHPSGYPDPSESDIHLTRRLVEAGRILGIPVIDHVVVTARGSVSLTALGVITS